MEKRNEIEVVYIEDGEEKSIKVCDFTDFKYLTELDIQRIVLSNRPKCMIHFTLTSRKQELLDSVMTVLCAAKEFTSTFVEAFMCMSVYLDYYSYDDFIAFVEKDGEAWNYNNDIYFYPDWTKEEYIDNYLENIGDSIPSWLKRYLDYDALAEDLNYDGVTVTEFGILEVYN